MGGIVSAADAKRIRGALINRITSRVTETDPRDPARSTTRAAVDQGVVVRQSALKLVISAM